MELITKIEGARIIERPPDGSWILRAETVETDEDWAVHDKVMWDTKDRKSSVISDTTFGMNKGKLVGYVSFLYQSEYRGMRVSFDRLGYNEEIGYFDSEKHPEIKSKYRIGFL